MGIESSLPSADSPYYLESKYRNVLQHDILTTLFERRGVTDMIEQGDIAEIYGKKISEIIDAPENEHIRMLARTGDYHAAKDAVFTLLGETDDMSMAA